MRRLPWQQGTGLSGVLLIKFKDMGAQKWFKFYGQEYLSDPKIERLTPVERSCWVTLLCMASTTEGKIRFLTVESLLQKSGVNVLDADVHTNVLKTFEDLEMIILSDNGDITLLNWEKRQETNLSAAERAKSYRDRKKVRHEIVTPRVTNVTQEESRVDKSRVDKRDTTPARDDISLGEFKKVKLTQKEYDQLITDLGENPTITLITELDQYIAGKGKDPYKDHYAVIKAWFRRRLQEHAAKFQSGKPKMI